MSGLVAVISTVTVTEANECVWTANATATQPAVLSASAVASPVLCNGGATGSIALTVTGGTTDYTYVWSNAATTEDLSVHEAVPISVTVTDANGCVAAARATVVKPAVLSAIAVASPVLCNGGATGSIALTVTGGTTDYTYVWSNAATTEDISGLVAGTYTVTVTDANGCVTTASATVTQPAVLSGSAVASPVLCNGGATGSIALTVTGGTTDYTYVWSNAATTEDISGLVAGTYTVTVTDANGCVTTASATVTQPAVLSASAVASPVLCNGGATGSIALTVTGGTTDYTYVWSNAATTEDI